MEKEFTYLHDLIWGYRTSRTLEAAVSVGLFAALSEGPADLNLVCERCGTVPDLTARLLAACQALGLVRSVEGKFANSDLSQRYLVPGSERYQGDIVAHAGNVRQFWDSLEAQLLGREPEQQSEQQRHRNFIMGMDNIARGGRAKLFLNSVDLSGYRNMLDVGGGPGSYSIAACRRYADLKSTVFDLPETVAIAREVIERDGMLDRVSVRAGDWNKDDFGSGYDAVLFSNVLHGPGSNAETKLAKARAAMTEDALLVIQEFVMGDEDSRPVQAAMFNLMVGAYRLSELMEVIVNAGFADVQVVGRNDEIGCLWVTAVKS